MNYRLLLILVVVAILPGCGIFSVPPTPDLRALTARDVLIRARNANWTARVSTYSEQLVGRVSFVEPDSARIGPRAISIGHISRIEQSAPVDLGGKRTGAIIGGTSGLVIGYLAREFWEYGYEQPCNLGCSLKIFGPTVGASALLGALVGAVASPPSREWVIVWERSR